MSAFQGTVHLVLRPSPLLRRLALTAHVFAVCAMATLFPATLAQALLVVATIVHGCWLHWRLARRHGGDVAALLLTSADAWRVTLGDGRVFDARLLGVPRVNACFTALRLKLANGDTHAVLLLADNVDADACRRLRMRLARVHEPDL